MPELMRPWDAGGADAEVNGGEAEGAAEAAGGDGLRRTRRPRAATRNIADLLADAEGTDEDEEPAEPELDSEQGGPPCQPV